MDYAFFTKSELSNIDINIDSAISFQTDIAKLKTYDEFIANGDNSYEEIDTIYYINQNNDLLKMLVYNQISIYSVPSHFTRTGTKAMLYASLTPLTDESFKNLSYILTKSSSELLLNKEINVQRPNYNWKKSIYYKCFSNDTESNCSSISYENFTWKNTTIDSCMIFNSYDSIGNEDFRVVYSSKNGFLYIKDKENEYIKN